MFAILYTDKRTRIEVKRIHRSVECMKWNEDGVREAPKLRQLIN